MKISHTFTAPLWQHSAQGGWYFVALPTDLSQEIRSQAKPLEEGWGRLKISAAVDGVAWNTSIWFDTKCGTYLLPIKAEIRKMKNLIVPSSVTVLLTW
ncbi:MAG: hypothetical protein RLZZ198_2204 [Bacteroidota bacterium]|jgi:hypothetical protein